MFNWLRSFKFRYESVDYSIYVPLKNSWKYTNNRDYNILSLSSKQSLLCIVKSEINYLQKESVSLTKESKGLYNLSNKFDLNSLKYFNELNNVRNKNRKIKQRIKRLAGIAKELKISIK